MPSSYISELNFATYLEQVHCAILKIQLHVKATLFFLCLWNDHILLYMMSFLHFWAFTCINDFNFFNVRSNAREQIDLVKREDIYLVNLFICANAHHCIDFSIICNRS